jgi:hypothetical protein
MSMDEFEDCFIWTCDGGCGLTAEFARGQPGTFRAAVDELKSRGWRISRDRHGEWDHRCGKCKAKVDVGLLDRPLRRVQ